MTSDALTIVSYGGYLNGESFQQEGILTAGSYQYAAYWNRARHVVLARRALPAETWEQLEFTDYTNTADDAHNTISLGACSGDGTLHLAFDHHTNDLHYRRSAPGFLTDPGAFTTSSFSATTSVLAASSAVTAVTYPRFIAEPGGDKLLFGARLGTSGSGDEHLWEYAASTHTWTELGRYLNGTKDDINGYPHGLSYTRGGTRLHVAWCWRETSDASTNHDLLYAYSDDHGRSWQSDAGDTVAVTGTSFLELSTPGLKVWDIGQNRGLINQEHMLVDGTGRVHVLLAHLPDAAPDEANFDNARTKTEYFHYLRDLDGTWRRHALGVRSTANFRGKLVTSSRGNAYAVLPDLRILGASAADGFESWLPLVSGDSNRYFSDPLVDTSRLAQEDTLTVFYPLRSSPEIHTLDYSLD